MSSTYINNIVVKKQSSNNWHEKKFISQGLVTRVIKFKIKVM